MLSRVADSIYWMNRYIERASNVSRFIDVNLHLRLDLPDGAAGQWGALVKITDDEAAFKERYDSADEASIVEFLTFDESNPNSIVACVTAARENARSIREIISSETWEALNEFYLGLRATPAPREARDNPHEFFRGIRKAGHLIAGALDETMSRGEAWHFARVGRSIERADKTTRILDIKYFLLLPAADLVGTPFDDLHWGAVLRSAGAFEMYRKVHGRVEASKIVRFLVLDDAFPRSVRFCLASALESLHGITGTPLGAFGNEAERRLGRLVSDLNYADERQLIKRGLHESLDDIQRRANEVGEAIYETFIEAKPATASADPRRL